MEENLKELSTRQLLTKYKRLARNGVSMFAVSDKERDAYYEKMIRIETEIISRTGE